MEPITNVCNVIKNVKLVKMYLIIVKLVPRIYTWLMEIVKKNVYSDITEIKTEAAKFVLLDVFNVLDPV